MGAGRGGGGGGVNCGGGGKGEGGRGVGDEFFWVGGESGRLEWEMGDGRWEMGDGWGRNELGRWFGWVLLPRGLGEVGCLQGEDEMRMLLMGLETACVWGCEKK